jgi:hypothetical protein
LEKRDTISSDDDINNFYTALKNPAGADITPDKKDKIAKDTENLYTNDLLANTYVNKLPIFKDF